MLESDRVEESKEIAYTNAAARLVLHGFSTPQSVVGLLPEEAVSLVMKPDEEALVRRCVEEVCHRHQLKAASEIAAAGGPGDPRGARENEVALPTSGEALVAKLQLGEFEKKLQKWIDDGKAFGIAQGGDLMRPRQAGQAIARSAQTYSINESCWTTRLRSFGYRRRGSPCHPVS